MLEWYITLLQKYKIAPFSCDLLAFKGKNLTEFKLKILPDLKESEIYQIDMKQERGKAVLK